MAPLRHEIITLERIMSRRKRSSSPTMDDPVPRVGTPTMMKNNRERAYDGYFNYHRNIWLNCVEYDVTTRRSINGARCLNKPQLR